MRNRSVTYSPARDVEAAFQVLADPTRRAVLDMLRRGSQPAGNIAGAFSVTRPAISKHLRLLRRAHLVREHREGRNRVYQLNPEPLRAVDSWLEHYRSFWSASLDNLKAFVEAEHARETHAATNDKAEAKELQAKVKLKVLKPVHAVFEGIIDPKQMSHYFISSGSARMEEGKTVTWAWADYGSGTMHVSIKKIEKDKFISFLWTATGVETLVEIKLEPVDPNITLITIVENGWPKVDKGIARLVQQTHGWVHFLCGLKVYLEHGINLRIGAF
jgi:DNA-binding transcriptional ArsR family regulator/uncharacterized protein YndB with AHSA1/START domain